MEDWLNQGWWGEHVTADTRVRRAPERTCPSCHSAGSTWIFERPGATLWVCDECQYGRAEESGHAMSDC
jgi:ribosomal protein L37AE/L43A